MNDDPMMFAMWMAGIATAVIAQWTWKKYTRWYQNWEDELEWEDQHKWVNEKK